VITGIVAINTGSDTRKELADILAAEKKEYTLEYGSMKVTNAQGFYHLHKYLKRLCAEKNLDYQAEPFSYKSHGGADSHLYVLSGDYSKGNSLADEHYRNEIVEQYMWLREKPFALGICKGLQILATQAGGTVERLPKRRVFNVLKFCAESGNGKKEYKVRADHIDHVPRLPQGFHGTFIDGILYEMWRNDSGLWVGMQYHPELTKKGLQRIDDFFRPHLPA
jgi:GMP synthase-like glutamine amidotransferase